MSLHRSHDDEKFLAAFAACTLQRSAWTHSAHIRMAWLQLQNCEAFDPALQRIKRSIQVYNAASASNGYHETITVAFTHLIQYRRLSDRSVRTYEKFFLANADLFAKTPPLLRNHYSEELLNTPAARSQFLAPDLKALPIWQHLLGSPV